MPTRGRLPSELYELFDLIMGGIKGRHKIKGRKLLRKLYVHEQDERQRQSHNPISAISLAQAEEDSSEVYRPLTAAEKFECCEITEHGRPPQKQNRGFA